MNDIVEKIFNALDDDKKSNSPFATMKTEKAFDSAYSKWNDMAKISDDDIKSDFIINDALAEIVSEERKQAFKVGLRTAFQLFFYMD